jgi:hypothetical protein
MQKNENGFKQIVKIQYALKSQITSIDENLDKTATVNFGTGTWVDLFSKLLSVEFTENSQDADAGISYSQKLNFEIQGDAETVNSEFYDLFNQEILLNLIYEDDSSKLLGDLLNPCFLLKDFSSKQLNTVHKFYINRADYKPALYLTT